MPSVTGNAAANMNGSAATVANRAGRARILRMRLSFSLRGAGGCGDVNGMTYYKSAFPRTPDFRIATGFYWVSLGKITDAATETARTPMITNRDMSIGI